MKRVLVAVDESEASRRVATFVRDFFAASDVELIGLHVGAGAGVAPSAAVVPPLAVGAWTYPVAPAVPLVPRGDVDELDSRVRDLDKAGEDVVRAAGIDADRTIVEYGDPADEIRHVAVQEDVDLIVVGSNHKGVIDRLLTGGSVSEELAKDAPRPVLVVQ